MSHPKPFVCPPVKATFYPVGQRCMVSEPGDVVLVHHYNSEPAHLIRVGEWLRSDTRDFNWTNHGCGVEEGGADAVVIQEVGSGAVRSPLSDFDAALYAVISPTKASLDQRAAAVGFWQWSLGSGYGVVSIIGDGLDDLTGLHLSLGTYGRMVCSAATCRGAERWGLIPDRDPTACQPANLAMYFGLSNQMADLAFTQKRSVSAKALLRRLESAAPTPRAA